MTFHQLHLAIQGVMKWENDHLYAFGPQAYSRDFRITMPGYGDDWYSGRQLSSRKVKIQEFLNDRRTKLVYTYDFGDDWIHNITLEKILDSYDAHLPVCIGGKGVCPMEDSGGIWSFMEFREEINELQKTTNLHDVIDYDSPDFDDELAWLIDEDYIDDNGKINFQAFDIEATQKRLKSYMK